MRSLLALLLLALFVVSTPVYEAVGDVTIRVADASASTRANRIERARREVIREQRSVDRVAAKLASMAPDDPARPRIERDLVQQRAQLTKAQDALAHATREGE